MPITTAADDIHKLFFHYFSEKIKLDVSSDSSARQRIHMKNQALFSSKDKSKKLKCRLLQFLFGALKVKVNEYTFRGDNSIFASLLSWGRGSTLNGKNSFLEEETLF